MNPEAPNKPLTKGRRLWLWMRRGLLGLLALVMATLIVSTIYQSIAAAREAARFTPPGKLVDVGGYRLHLNCQGQGSPTIVLDAGLGEASLSWSKVQPAAARFTRVCSYDRAGYAWSERGPTPRTSAQIVKELQTLLVNAGEQKPYVLAGHSFGGYNVRLFAAQYPDETAGLVLVDSSHEDQFERLPPSFRTPWWAELLMRATPWLSRLGVLRMLGKPIGNVEDYAPDAQPLARGIGFQSTAYDSALAEFVSLLESAAQVRAVKMTGGKLLMGDKPLTVLSQGDADKIPKLYSPAERAEFMKVWDELQTDLATRSANGKLIVAEKSGHYVLLEEPQLVIDALQRACESFNKKAEVLGKGRGWKAAEAKAPAEKRTNEMPLAYEVVRFPAKP